MKRHSKYMAYAWFLVMALICGLMMIGGSL
jgi:hypothetical protein